MSLNNVKIHPNLTSSFVIFIIVEFKDKGTIEPNIIYLHTIFGKPINTCESVSGKLLE